MKTIVLLLFLSQPTSVADSTKPVSDPIFRGVLKARPGYTYNRKHQLFFQLFGDTPIIGMGYMYRAWENPAKNITVETSVGFGLNPFAGFDNGSGFRNSTEATPVNFSHNIKTVLFRKNLVSPYLSYSGIWWSGRFYEGKTFNYRPTGGVGIRIGNSDRFAVQVGLNVYQYKFTSVEITESVVSTFRNKAIMGIPSFSFIIPFGAKPALK